MVIYNLKRKLNAFSQADLFKIDYNFPLDFQVDFFSYKATENFPGLVRLSL